MSKRQEARERLRRRRELAKARKRQGAGEQFEPPKQVEPREKPKQTVAPGKKETDRQRQLEIEALERGVADLTRLSAPTGETRLEIERIRREVDELKRDFYTHLDAWQRLQLARHPQRPYTDDFIRILFENFSEIHGDRNFSDDPALITGMATFHGQPVMIIGNQKGRDTKQRLARNFGQAKPEGYRKAPTRA